MAVPLRMRAVCLRAVKTAAPPRTRSYTLPVRSALVTYTDSATRSDKLLTSDLNISRFCRCLCGRAPDNAEQKPTSSDHSAGNASGARSRSKYYKWLRPWPSRRKDSDSTPKKKSWLDDHEARSISLAFVVNAGNFILKVIIWFSTGSHSMGAEALHSFLDMCNQGFLLYGYKLSLKAQDAEHPYGYRKIRTVAALVGGCMLFSLGSITCMSHAAYGLLYGDAFHSEGTYYAVLALAGSLISESASFFYTLSGTWKASQAEGVNVWEYVRSGQQPLASIVIYEDITAVAGVAVAATCMMLSSVYGIAVFDMAGEAIVGLMLAAVARKVWVTYGQQLNYKSIPFRKRIAMEEVIRRDQVVKAVHDCKTTDLGMGCYRLKAEVDFNGREITRRVLENRQGDTLENIQNMTDKELHTYLLDIGEDVTTATAKEIDRIEKTLKELFPGLIHIDIEPN